MGNAIEQARKSLREAGIPIGSALAREETFFPPVTTDASKTTIGLRTPNWLPAKCRRAWQFSRHRFIFDVDSLLPLRGRRRAIRNPQNHRRRQPHVCWRADFMRSHGAKLISIYKNAPR
jgi:hypothetical protein